MWRQIKRGLRTLVNPAAADRDLADEVEHYFEEAAAAWEARGLAPDEARRTARRELGNTLVVREEVRSSGWEHAVETFLADLRYAARGLSANPGFTAVAALTIALGVGASTAIFGAVNPILFEPLPYQDARRVATIWDIARDGSRLDVTFGTYRELVARSHTLENLAVMKPWLPTMTSVTQPERLDGQRVSATYFRTLGVRPAIGRDFEAADDVVNGPRVVIVSDGVWRRRFGGQDEIVGRQITLDDSSFTVIAVMPPMFDNVLSPSADVWAPLQYDASLPLDGREWGHHLRLVARLQRGVGADDADRELDAIAQAPASDFPRAPWALLKSGFIVSSLQDDVTRGVKPALLAVSGAALVVLAIACLNVTNLLLARTSRRRGEFAMRAALGAGRARLVRQLITESLLVAALGGALGLGVAAAGVRVLVSLAPAGLPRASAIGVDGAVFAFAFGITILIGVLIGLMPARHATRGELHGSSYQISRRTAGGHPLARRSLVVAEVALALVLLVSAGLLLRSLQRLFAVDPGFKAAHVLTMQVQTSGRRFVDARVTHQFFADALDAVRQVPGVTAAAYTSQLPLSGDDNMFGVHFESSPAAYTGEDRGAFRYAVSPGYFELLGIPLRRGRLLDNRDVAGMPLAVVLNESFARRRFPGLDPIGQRLRVGPDSGPWFTVVGVVGDVKQTSLALSRTDAVYTTTSQWLFTDSALWLVASVEGDAAALAPAIRRAVWSVDKDQPIVRVATLAGLVSASAAERRYALMLFETFALVALVLAAIGIYGVLSGGVTERTREIGVRSALGASRVDIVSMVIREGLTLTGLGAGIGLAGALAASGALVTLLFGVTRLDPITYLGVLALVGGVSAIASAIPAWRAAWVDPSITLRAD